MYTVRRKDAARLAWTKHTKEVSGGRDIRYSAIVTCSSLRSVAINNTGYGQSLILYIASPVDFASYLSEFIEFSQYIIHLYVITSVGSEQVYLQA
jgi:hypothetical protein